MAMSNNMFCGVCKSRNISNLPVIWCSECDDGFCTDCKEHHSVLKLSRNHTTISTEEYQQLPAFIREINLFCEIHNEKYQIFCKKHDCTCCSRCVVESHNDCKEIVSLDDVIRNAKSSVSFDENRNELEDMSKNILKMRTSRQDNLSIITEQRKRIEKEILDTRKKINDRLDELQDNILKELHQTADTSNHEIQRTLSSLAQQEQKVKGTQLNMANITKFASELQAFLGLKQIGEDVMKSDSALNSLINSDALSHTSLSYTFDDILQSIFDKVSRFGNVVVQTKPSGLVISKTKDKQAQHMTVDVRPKTTDQIKLKLQTTLATQADYKTTGCSILSDGNVVYSCYSSGVSTSRVISLDDTGSELYTIKLKSAYAGDLAFVDDVTIAVASGGSKVKCINMIDLNTKDVLRCIKTDFLSDGILCKDGDLVCCAREKGLVRIDVKDGSITQILSCALSSYSYVAEYKGLLYYTHRVANTVICSDNAGKTIWEFKNDDKLKEPKGIAIDGDGNIYVAGCKSDNVVVITSDGKQFRELLSKQDGLDRPAVLHFDKSSNRLLVANEYKFAFLFCFI